MQLAIRSAGQISRPRIVKAEANERTAQPNFRSRTPPSTVLLPEQGACLTRRTLFGAGLLSVLPFLRSESAFAGAAPETPLCDGACLEQLESTELKTTSSGLQYKDLIVGKGPKSPVGYQVAPSQLHGEIRRGQRVKVVAHVVALTEDGQIVDNSKERNMPYDIRVGAGQVVAGLDEGLADMRVGSLRRLYVPGSLGFTETLRAAPGRPRIEANTPLIIDVQLLYIPGRVSLIASPDEDQKLEREICRPVLYDAFSFGKTIL